MEYITIKEGEKLYGIHRRCIYAAIKNGRIKSYGAESDKCHTICKEELKNYIDTKYNRNYFIFNGALKFDKKKGEYSIRQAAEYLGVKDHFLYCRIKSGKIKCTRKGCSYVLDKSELNAIKKNLLAK